jgi:DNA-directed RNA polymerase subunit M/transcription elongation factor TFIIS
MGKAPEKNCPECKTALHVRKIECTCGYEFPKKKNKKKAKKSKREENISDLEEVEMVFEGWKKVPPRSRNITCGLCRKKMKGGDLGWHHAYDDGDKFWWCKRCETDDDYISPVVSIS